MRVVSRCFEPSQSREYSEVIIHSKPINGPFPLPPKKRSHYHYSFKQDFTPPPHTPPPSLNRVSHSQSFFLQNVGQLITFAVAAKRLRQGPPSAHTPPSPLAWVHWLSTSLGTFLRNTEHWQQLSSRLLQPQAWSGSFHVSPDVVVAALTVLEDAWVVFLEADASLGW